MNRERNRLGEQKKKKKITKLQNEIPERGNFQPYLDDLRAVNLLQLGEAVVDPLGVGSPLQQVQHVACREAKGAKAESQTRTEIKTTAADS